jgi:hypothetical protein
MTINELREYRANLIQILKDGQKMRWHSLEVVRGSKNKRIEPIGEVKQNLSDFDIERINDELFKTSYILSFQYQKK